MKKQIVLLGGIVVAVILSVIAWQLYGPGSMDSDVADQAQSMPVDDPMDITMELYGPWLDGLQATTTEFNRIDLLTAAPLTDGLRARLLQLQMESETAIDPVICQAEIPERIGVKTIYINETESQVVVVPRGKKVPEQALVTLVAVDGKWVISDITCSRGELAPEVEFTFEQEGNLLKQSLQPPLNNEQWHLIYTKNGVAGNVIPVLFDSTSICISSDGVEQVCVPDQLTEAVAVLLQGQMQEAGVLVERMQLR